MTIFPCVTKNTWALFRRLEQDRESLEVFRKDIGRVFAREVPLILDKKMDQYVDKINGFLNNDHDDAPISKYAQSVTLPISQTIRQDANDNPRFDHLWDALILVAENQLLTDDTTKLDRLAELVRAIKDLGPLVHSGQTVKTDVGTAWTDLPYLGAQIREAWNTAPPKSSTEQWANLNGFAARLTASETQDFSLFAIWALRDALETPRPLTERQTSGGDTQAKSEEEVSVDELLPAVLQWLEYWGDGMVALTVRSHVYTKEGQSNDPAFLGKLANDAGIAKGGYSVRRWGFWRKRLEEISKAKDDAGGREKIAKLAYQGLEKMKQIDNEMPVMNEDMDGLHNV